MMCAKTTAEHFLPCWYFAAAVSPCTRGSTTQLFPPLSSCLVLLLFVAAAVRFLLLVFFSVLTWCGSDSETGNWSRVVQDVIDLIRAVNGDMAAAQPKPIMGKQQPQQQQRERERALIGSDFGRFCCLSVHYSGQILGVSGVLYLYMICIQHLRQDMI